MPIELGPWPLTPKKSGLSRPKESDGGIKVEWRKEEAEISVVRNADGRRTRQDTRTVTSFVSSPCQPPPLCLSQSISNSIPLILAEGGVSPGFLPREEATNEVRKGADLGCQTKSQERI